MGVLLPNWWWASLGVAAPGVAVLMKHDSGRPSPAHRERVYRQRRRRARPNSRAFQGLSETAGQARLETVAPFTVSNTVG